MNKVILVGRLTKDAEVRHSTGENATAIARFTMAVDRRAKRDEADFIGCVAFGKTAEFLENYGKKGIKFALVGRIQTGSYEKDGKRVYTTDVVVEELSFVESKGTASESSASAPDMAFVNVPDDMEDLPFAR